MKITKKLSPFDKKNSNYIKDIEATMELRKHLVPNPLLCCCIASVVSDSVQPHRWQPTRLPRPWDSPGKNTGVGCHFPLQCVKVKSEVPQSCLTLSDPMDCSPPGSSVHGTLQARVLEWGAIAFFGSVALLLLLLSRLSRVRLCATP